MIIYLNNGSRPSHILVERRQPLARPASEPRPSRAAALRASAPPRTPAPARTPSTPSRLSVSEYFTAQRLKRSSQRASPSCPRAPNHQIMDPRELFGEEGEVDESMEGSPNRGDEEMRPHSLRSPSRRDPDRPALTAPVRPPSRPPAERAAPPRVEPRPPLRTPNPFPQRSSGLYEMRALTEPRYSPPRGEDGPLGPVVSNRLEEAQSEQVAAQTAPMHSQRPELWSLLNPSVADYGFRPARLLTPQPTTVAEYRERFRLQTQQKSVPAMRTHPVALNPREDSIDRKLSSMEALRAM
ncbi:hypothetical protein PHYSODRAFT_334164 [Phytophthora sojae]|uniref:Uncharacterized protein n=1 Tax=Phytophthora sojae (strain P6497) TaxID=1094619 RepID=G4ZLC5_PHYSP|nr:hypothetical protein PHYSODRAFT_334164 [Phytophthora sojae]EGZ15971.1 hypothetical protein PHYSODRAFT_334164 [Phytophthora sojae]|eukprot:XP_009529720.1 hypothetical protein PHYSODRAFT_334164 [Phytophthora sojae]